MIILSREDVICTLFHNGDEGVNEDEKSSKSSIFSMLILSREEVICAIFFLNLAGTKAANQNP